MKIDNVATFVFVGILNPSVESSISKVSISY